MFICTKATQQFRRLKSLLKSYCLDDQRVVTCYNNNNNNSQFHSYSEALKWKKQLTDDCFKSSKGNALLASYTAILYLKDTHCDLRVPGMTA